VRVGIAVALIILPVALLTGYGHWLATRDFTPLDIPVSLSHGHIRTNDFYVNITGEYFVDFIVDRSFSVHPECLTYGPKAVLAGHLKLLRNGQVLGETDEPNYLISFDVEEKGHYQLDLDVQSDASCLNAGHPRMVMFTDWYFYKDLNERAHWFLLVPILGGLGLLGRLILVFFWKRQEKSQQGLIFERFESGRGAWRPKLPQTKPTSTLPSFGLFCGTILSFVVIAFMMIFAIRPLPKGIRVFIRNPHPEITLTGVTGRPIVVPIEDRGPNLPYRLYVGSKLVSRNELESALSDELKRRPDWVVGVEADPNLPWMAVVDAVDGIKQVQAKAVLLTPETSRWMHERYSENPTRQPGTVVNQHH